MPRWASHICVWIPPNARRTTSYLMILISWWNSRPRRNKTWFGQRRVLFPACRQVVFGQPPSTVPGGGKRKRGKGRGRGYGDSPYKSTKRSKPNGKGKGKGKPAIIESAQGSYRCVLMGCHIFGTIFHGTPREVSLVRGPTYRSTIGVGTTTSCTNIPLSRGRVLCCQGLPRGGA